MNSLELSLDRNYYPLFCWGRSFRGVGCFLLDAEFRANGMPLSSLDTNARHAAGA